jgi:hypothetical protein
MTGNPDRRRWLSVFRDNPDLWAVALLSVFLFVATSIASPYAQSWRESMGFRPLVEHSPRVTMRWLPIAYSASWVEAADESPEQRIDERRSRVWGRLEERMRRFEQRYERLRRVKQTRLVSTTTSIQ